jgi:hypothetical protein
MLLSYAGYGRHALCVMGLCLLAVGDWDEKCRIALPVILLCPMSCVGARAQLGAAARLAVFCTHIGCFAHIRACFVL